MKLSNKLLFVLATFLISSFVLSNLVLKEQYNNIDKNDKFWEFKHKDTLSFSNLSIDGGNGIYLSILYNPSKNGIIYREELKKNISYKVEKDSNMRVKYQCNK